MTEKNFGEVEGPSYTDNSMGRPVNSKKFFLGSSQQTKGESRNSQHQPQREVNAWLGETTYKRDHD